MTKEQLEKILAEMKRAKTVKLDALKLQAEKNQLKQLFKSN
jgi:hypothetical protein